MEIFWELCFVISIETEMMGGLSRGLMGGRGLGLHLVFESSFEKFFN